jgi:hypothetical protein
VESVFYIHVLQKIQNGKHSSQVLQQEKNLSPKEKSGKIKI